MSTWSRTIRPFLGLGTLQDVLAQCLLHFGTDSCQSDGSLQVDIAPHEFSLRPVTLDWTTDDESFTAFRVSLAAGANEAEIPLEGLELVAIATTPFLRIAEVIFRHSLGDLKSLSRSVRLSGGSQRPRALSAPQSGFRVDAHLVLSRSRKREPLRPFRKGTWLSRARFSVTTSVAASILPPSPLTDEVRQRLNLPAKAMRYVDWNEHDVLEPKSTQADPVLYVDADLLAQLNSRRGSSISRAIQVQLVVDFLNQVLQRAAETGDELRSRTFEDVRDGLLGSVIRIASGPGATDARRTRMLHEVANDTGRVMAYVEHAVDVISAYAASVKDGDA